MSRVDPDSIEARNPIITPKRQDRVGQYLIREELFDKIRAGVESGFHIADAAEKAGVPYELVLARVHSDPGYRQLYLDSRHLPRRTRIRRHEGDTLSPLQIKHDFMTSAVEAGIFEKVLEMYAMADHMTEDGSETLKHFVEKVMPMLPKEIASKVEHKTDNSLEEVSVEDLKIALEKKQARLSQLEGQITDVKMRLLDRASNE